MYISPQGKFSVLPWSGALAGNDGYVVIDLGSYSAPETTTFPLAEINEFLTTYGLAFTITEQQAVGFAGSGYTTTSGSSGGYHYLKLVIVGNVFNAFYSSMNAALVEAGYTLKQSSSGYYYENADQHQIVFSTDGFFTTITFWE